MRAIHDRFQPFQCCWAGRWPWSSLCRILSSIRFIVLCRPAGKLPQIGRSCSAEAPGGAIRFGRCRPRTSSGTAGTATVYGGHVVAGTATTWLVLTLSGSALMVGITGAFLADRAPAPGAGEPAAGLRRADGWRAGCRRRLLRLADDHRRCESRRSHRRRVPELWSQRSAGAEASRRTRWPLGAFEQFRAALAARLPTRRRPRRVVLRLPPRRENRPGQQDRPGSGPSSGPPPASATSPRTCSRAARRRVTCSRTRASAGKPSPPPRPHTAPPSSSTQIRSSAPLPRLRGAPRR